MGPTLTNFEKFPPPQKKSPLHVYWFLRFFPPSTPRLLELCISFFHKIPPSTFIPTSTFSDLANFAPPPRLFQPPRLLKRWEYPKHYYKRWNVTSLLSWLHFGFGLLLEKEKNFAICIICDADYLAGNSIMLFSFFFLLRKKLKISLLHSSPSFPERQ